MPEGDADVTLAPLLEEGLLEEEFILDAGVDMILAPVLEEGFERGDACAPTCSKKYIDVSPNARINAIAIQEVCLISHYPPSLASLGLSQT